MLTNRFRIDASVNTENNNQRNVKRKGTGEENVVQIIVHGTRLIVGKNLILPAKVRRHGNENGDEPGQNNGEDRSTTRDDQRIAQWSCHADVTFDGNTHQPVDTRRGIENIDRQPNVTENSTEWPRALKDFLCRREWQNGDPLKPLRMIEDDRKTNSINSMDVNAATYLTTDPHKRDAP